jgi:hypothetical protein
VIVPADLRAALEAERYADAPAGADTFESGWNAALERALEIVTTAAARTEAAREATKGALRAEGKHVGGRIPYGFLLADDGESLIENPAEQAIRAAAGDLRNRWDGPSYGKVAAELNARGHRARSGEPFTAMQVYRMIQHGDPEDHAS